MDRIARILGKTAHASITFRAQRHVQIAELTVKARLQTIVAAGQAATLESALRHALAHAEHQALRYRDRNYGAQTPAQRGESADRAARVRGPRRAHRSLKTRPATGHCSRQRHVLPLQSIRFPRAPPSSSRTSSRAAKPSRSSP